MSIDIKNNESPSGIVSPPLPMIADETEQSDIRGDLLSTPFSPAPERPTRLLLIGTWICVLAMVSFYIVRMTRLGIDLRVDFWAYWENNRFYGDINSALGHGLHVLREAEEIEQEDRQNETPAQRDAEDRGELPTIARPGPGLFDSPHDLSTIVQRWHRLRPVYAHIFTGWQQTYDHLQRDVADGEYQMDYPPLRCMVMTLWAWKVQADHPGISQFPRGPEQEVDPNTGHVRLLTPDIAHPLLMCNMFFEGMSSIAMFFLVWIWMERRTAPVIGAGWRSRWGDPALLAPVICFMVFSILRPHISFDWAIPRTVPSLLDDRVTSIGWWIFLVLRFTSIIALAHFLPRPFRGLICALLAATLIWINPATILDSYGWPQWDAWLPPFFLTAAVLVSLDWWLTAGLVLAIGFMFKGQLLFVAPVLLLCPLFAGWIWRFLRIVAGLTAGAGIIVWPWLAAQSNARAYICSAIFAAFLICIISISRKRVGRELRRISMNTADWAKARWLKQPSGESLDHNSEIPVHHWIAIGMAFLTAAWLVHMISHHEDSSLRPFSTLLTIAVLTVPWFIPRRHFAAWIVIVFSASLWLAAASLGGSFSWWNIGFVYGTQKHQAMQLGMDSLSNLSSILENRYRWSLHDDVGVLHLPFVSAPIDMDVQTALAVVFALALLVCTIAAAVHLRRNDKKFLAALVAPWILFVTLLTQMAARYMVLAAVVSAALVSVSVSVSLLQLLVTVLACVMLGNQLLAPFPNTAPVTYSITQPTFPDAGWLVLLVAALFLCIAITPSKAVKLQT